MLGGRDGAGDSLIAAVRESECPVRGFAVGCHGWLSLLANLSALSEVEVRGDDDLDCRNVRLS